MLLLLKKKLMKEDKIMKMKNPMIVVEDMERSVKFYKEVLGLRVIMDFGANVTLTGGMCLQTKDSWMKFLGMTDGDMIRFGGNDAEVYFEEDEFDGFIEKLSKIDGIRYVHPVQEHSWGQRVVRIYDPDQHVIEIGENIKVVCRRFLESGMTVEETAKRMDVPLKFVHACMR